MSIITKIFGTRSDREIKKILPLVDEIEALEDEYRKLSDEQLRAKTVELKQRLADGETMDDILPEAFATVREAADRVLGERPFHVQLIGGIVLHQGRIAEMKTGEGKTLVATLPAYLNALGGNGVHIVTVNDYLAKLQGEWMGKVHSFLGLKVGVIVHGLTNEERREAYAADITYGTNNEMGFDYLRDNMAMYKQELVQRGHVYAIVDEVDSILIDEARTPLIISGQGEDSSDLYQKVDAFVTRLKRITYATTDEKSEEDANIDADYVVDEKSKSATLTARGIAKAEAAFGLENLADLENSTLAHHINQALKAHGIMHLDIDYVVKEGEVIIVDEFTGRLMQGRRYSEGLHQAIEAKEKVKVASESRTLATITFQNYFRMFDKLSGMTGTAMTEENEFGDIYKLDIVDIPTNRPIARLDRPDVVYKNENGKYRAIIAQIQECHEKGQPVLVGTVSIEKSELLSSMLRKTGIKHNVLNAKQHDKEAEIVAQAGRFGAVTIATNMAGRGTDIKLGGNPEYMAKNDMRKEGFEEEVITETTSHTKTDDETILAARARYNELYKLHKVKTTEESEKVKTAGGLFILGTERHESRRIDNQLRGRAGRQGDPGETRFFISMTDDIMRLFGSERIMGMMDTLGVDEDTPIDQKILSNAMEQAQKRVESKNFESRKTILEYDDVMNKQRELIYEQRNRVLNGEDIGDYVRSMISDIISKSVGEAMGEMHYVEGAEQLNAILTRFEGLYIRKGDVKIDFKDLNDMTAEELGQKIEEKAFDYYGQREREMGLIEGTEIPLMRELERVVLLRVVDEFWMDHIDAMDDLRQGIFLRSFANVKPVDEYKREGFEMFDAMINGIKEEVIKRMFVVRIRKEQPLERKSVVKGGIENLGGEEVKKQPVKNPKKIGRNDPCPCGKLKPDGTPVKYKNCCGRDA
jgi:preprotein translocase subunit SecA